MSRATRLAAKQADRARREAIRVERRSQRQSTPGPHWLSLADIPQERMLAAMGMAFDTGDSPAAIAKGFVHLPWDEAITAKAVTNEDAVVILAKMPEVRVYCRPDGSTVFMEGIRSMYPEGGLPSTLTAPPQQLPAALAEQVKLLRQAQAAAG
jgi:hypothetical protein